MVSVEINMVLLLMQINLRRTVFQVLSLSKCNVSDSSLKKLDRATLKNCYQRSRIERNSFNILSSTVAWKHNAVWNTEITATEAFWISEPMQFLFLLRRNLPISLFIEFFAWPFPPWRNTTLSYYQFARAIFVSKISPPNVKIVILYYPRLISKQDTETRVKRTNIRFSIGRH